MYSLFPQITIPDVLQGLFAAGVLYLVTEGLKVVGSWFGKDLSGSASAISSALVAAIMVFANQLLALIPEAYAPVVEQALSLVVLILTASGLFRTVKKLRPF